VEGEEDEGKGIDVENLARFISRIHLVYAADEQPRKARSNVIVLVRLLMRGGGRGGAKPAVELFFAACPRICRRNVS